MVPVPSRPYGRCGTLRNARPHAPARRYTAAGCPLASRPRSARRACCGVACGSPRPRPRRRHGPPPTARATGFRAAPSTGKGSVPRLRRPCRRSAARPLRAWRRLPPAVPLPAVGVPSVCSPAPGHRRGAWRRAFLALCAAREGRACGRREEKAPLRRREGKRKAPRARMCAGGQPLHGAAYEARTRYLHLGKVALYHHRRSVSLSLND